MLGGSQTAVRNGVVWGPFHHHVWKFTVNQAWALDFCKSTINIVLWRSTTFVLEFCWNRQYLGSNWQFSLKLEKSVSTKVAGACTRWTSSVHLKCVADPGWTSWVLKGRRTHRFYCFNTLRRRYDGAQMGLNIFRKLWKSTKYSSTGQANRQKHRQRSIAWQSFWPLARPMKLLYVYNYWSLLKIN